MSGTLLRKGESRYCGRKCPTCDFRELKEGMYSGECCKGYWVMESKDEDGWETYSIEEEKEKA